MNILMKFKVYGESYLAVRNEVPLRDFIEARANTLKEQAPEGETPFYTSVQPDGGILRTELVKDDKDLSDEPVLRWDMGDAHSDLHQQRATSTMEEISRYEMNIRDLQESLRNQRDKQDQIIKGTHEYHFAKRDALKNMLATIIVSLGDMAAMFLLWADYSGLDPMKIGTAIAKHPVSVFLTALFTVGSFIPSLLMAEKVLHAKSKVINAFCLIGLIVIAVLVGFMRASQVAAMQETDMSALFQTVLFSIISFGFPLAAAFYARKWREASQFTGLTDSALRRSAELESLYNDRLAEANKGWNDAHKELDVLTKEYVEHYQDALTEREKAKNNWERHMRYVESYLAEARLAYKFWDGWMMKRIAIQKPVKKLLHITGAMVIAISLSLFGCQKAYAEGKFNLFALCDRSSSAGEFSCTSKTIEEAGRYWLEKADEDGGGAFELFLIDKSFDSTSILFSETFPERFPGPVTAHKKKYRNDFLKRLTEATKNLPMNKGSAIVEAIHRSSLRIPDDGEVVLYVMSDMREVNESFNFERQVPPEKVFTKWLDGRAIRPKFKGTTRLFICGVHPYTPSATSRMTTENYDRLLKLWQAVFKKWGVEATISEACGLNN